MEEIRSDDGLTVQIVLNEPREKALIVLVADVLNLGEEYVEAVLSEAVRKDIEPSEWPEE